MSDKLSPNTIRKALTKLGDLLEEQGETATLTICGGASMILLEALDRPTKDVDSIRKLNHLMVEIKNVVSKDLGIPEDWLNDTVAVQPGIWPRYFDEIIQTEIVFRHKGLTVFSATKEFMKILKARAMITNPRDSSRHATDVLALGFGREEIPEIARHIQKSLHSEGITNMLDEEIVTQLGITIFDDDV